MSVRHRGFALIVVLVAAAGVFALALQGAVMARSATIESRVLQERMAAERAANSAAAMTLLAVSGPGGASGASMRSGTFGGGGSDGPRGGAGDSADKPQIELPPIIREMLGDKADDLERQAREETNRPGRTGGSAGSGGRTSRSAEGAVDFALPVAPVEARIPGGFVCRVYVSDAAGGLNVNLASEAELRRYFELKLGDPLLAASLTDELLDWRDEDHFTRPRGAERAVYDRLGLSARDGPLQSREELRFLPSMTEALYERIRRDLDVAGDNKVHAGSASRETLACIEGMSIDAADEIIRLRREAPLTDKAIAAAIPLSAREAASERLRVRPSPLVRVRVDVLREGERGVMVFEGLAVVGSDGIRALGLKPSERPS